VLKHDLVGVFRRWYPRLHAHTRWTGGVIRGRRRGGGWPQPIRVHLPTGLITSLSEEVFFARLRLQQNNHEIDVDSRPSDAIALAVRFECRIFVSAEVLDRAGVIHEHDKDEEKVPEEKVDEGRLAVFRDLFNSLDRTDPPDEPGSPGRGSSSS
jgi:hypothetical protein